jgi:hypothetical protein
MKNIINDQMWSWIFVLTGVTTVIVLNHFRLSTDIGAGIIGAGLQAYTAGAKSQTNVNSVVDNAVKQ